MEETTRSSTTTISTASSSNLSAYKEYLLQPLDTGKQQALGLKFCEKLGIQDPRMCELFAQTFREVQLEELQRFDGALYSPEVAVDMDGLGDEVWE
jgi:hypothetical protein